MTGVYRAPITPGQQWCDDNGAPLALGTLQTLLAGTLTPQATFTSATGAVANATTITFDADGRLPSGADVWFSGGVAYRFIIKTAAGVTIDDKDNLTGANDPAFASSGFGEWIAGPDPTFIAASPPQFSVVGDQRSLFQVARRVRLTDNAVLLTATVRASAFAVGVTTVTLVMDDGATLSNQLSAVEYALLAAEPRSGPMPYVVALSDAAQVLQFSGAPHTIYRSGAIAAPRIYTLPPVAPEGAVLDFYNEDSADAITLDASGAAGVGGYVLPAGAWVRLIVVAADGVTDAVADWRKIDGSDVVAVLTSGTSWVPPLGVYRVWAEVYGGGGGGYDGAGAATTNRASGGGGAGGVAKGSVITTPGVAVSYAIGAAGARGAGGTAGGNSTFGALTGNGGAAGAVLAGGAGGTATGGEVNVSGGGGGAGAGSYEEVSAGVPLTSGGGVGGSNDRGCGGAGGSSATAGGDGTPFGGGGGGGGGSTASASANGGAGGAGRVLLIY